MGQVQDLFFKDALSERYLAYALSTIMSRSLPDVRDGLKPVHRRLIYAMKQLHLNPKSGFKKSARIVGDVMGQFHPHGDVAIYDALVRLAQDFSVRYPLIEGQGNFGNIDGDNAAAMRYTEARLTEVAHHLLEDIDEDAIDFRPTYDGESVEPVVLPASFPNLLANGATGIAVGMATSIPPHNLGELFQALSYLLEHPHASVMDLMRFVPGPDFPTGGIIIDPKETLLKAYETGRGSIRLRARYEMEQHKIIITEIPYLVEKSKIIKKIVHLLLKKKIPLLQDILDESTDNIRLVLEPKNRHVDPVILMEMLYKQTDLESRFSINLNALDQGKSPKVMSLKKILRTFIDFRLDILIRRTIYRIKKIDERLELLKGYLIVYLNLDDVISIIREKDDLKQHLTKRFELTEFQAEAILNMRLRSLRKLQEIEIKKEYDTLLKEQQQLKILLDTPKLQKAHLRNEFKKSGKNFSLGKRRTTIQEIILLPEIPTDSFIEKEDITLICSAKGWIRTVKSHDIQELKYKEGDQEWVLLKARTSDKLLIFASNGKFYTLNVDKLPKGRGFGDPLRLFIDLDNKDEILHLYLYKSNEKYLVVSQDGRGFIVKSDDVLAQTKTGKIILSLPENIKAKGCFPVSSDHLALIGENRQLLIFPVTEIPLLSRGRGVKLQTYKQGFVSDIRFIYLEEGLTWKKSGKNYVEKDLKPWLGKRAIKGRFAPLNFPKTNKFS